MRTNRESKWICLLLVLCVLSLAGLAGLHAQHAAFRMKGRVVTDRGEPIADAAVRAEAHYGYAAGTFSGQRIYTAQSNAKGEWNIGAMQPGIWHFHVLSTGRISWAGDRPFLYL